jgi:predicted unusual protein kinase regulating ubiquinone biosynthesis (AarF/ABC1/UbiB family)
MKGLSMKLGQMLSYIDLEVPEGLRLSLGRLQQASTAMPPGVVARILEEDLGQPPAQLFAQWAATPVAAASIGQVHRARLHDGTEVAVKVRFSHIERAVRDDLKNVQLMRHFFGLLAPELDKRALMTELTERFLEECDYRNEAQHLQQFYAFFAGTDGVLIPKVYLSHCSQRVLTMDWIEGQRFSEFTRNANEAERNRAARLIHDFAFRSIFQLGALNCDPHPGNYLFAQNAVAFIDFGCVRRFSPHLVEAWRSMLQAALEQDHARFRTAVVQVGLAKPDSNFDFNAHYAQYLYMIRPWLTSEALSFTPKFVAQTYRALLFSNPNRKNLCMPRELVFANRLQWGLYSVLAELGATDSLRQAILDILYEPGAARPRPFTDSELRRYISALEQER